MKLICLTTCTTGSDAPYAVIELTPLLATALLRDRDVFLAAVAAAEVKDANPPYCVESFDYSVSYGSSLLVGDRAVTDASGDLMRDWLVAPDDLELAEEEDGFDATAETLRAKANGCEWQATGEAGDHTVETDTLPWEAIEQLAKGERPADLKELAYEFDADEEQDDDGDEED